VGALKSAAENPAYNSFAFGNSNRILANGKGFCCRKHFVLNRMATLFFNQIVCTSTQFGHERKIQEIDNISRKTEIHQPCRKQEK
jgi:hypothetical protein